MATMGKIQTETIKRDANDAARDPSGVAQVQPLTDEEVTTLRAFIREFSIIRGVCPMAVRALSKR